MNPPPPKAIWNKPLFASARKVHKRLLLKHSGPLRQVLSTFCVPFPGAWGSRRLSPMMGDLRFTCDGYELKLGVDLASTRSGKGVDSDRSRALGLRAGAMELYWSRSGAPVLLIRSYNAATCSQWHQAKLMIAGLDEARLGRSFPIAPVEILYHKLLRKVFIRTSCFFSRICVCVCDCGALHV